MASGIELDAGGFFRSLEQALAIIAARAEEDTRRLGEDTARAAKQNAPVETGRLRDSIHTEEKLEPDGIAVDVVAGVDYAPFVEFGTSHNSPDPFMRRALAEARAKAKSVYRR